MSLLRASVLLALVLVSGCIHRFYDTEARTVDPSAEVVQVDAPLRAHLIDGDVALFRSGAQVGPAAVEGDGVRYDIARRDSARVQRVAMDSVLGVESFRSDLRETKSVLVSAGATVGTAVLVLGGIFSMLLSMASGSP